MSTTNKQNQKFRLSLTYEQIIFLQAKLSADAANFLSIDHEMAIDIVSSLARLRKSISSGKNTGYVVGINTGNARKENANKEFADMSPEEQATYLANLESSLGL